MDLEKTEAGNDCAGEGQQQFNRLIDLKVFFKLRVYLVPCVSNRIEKELCVSLHFLPVREQRK
jgi:hypothetical protein